MNWLSKISPPGVKKLFEKRDTPDNLWIKCPKSGELIYQKDLEAMLWVTPAGHHMKIGADVRFEHLFDGGKREEIVLPDVPKDPLKFKDSKKYTDRLKAARSKTEREDCMSAAKGTIGGNNAIILVQDFAFMGGSLGMAAGEAFIAASHEAIKTHSAMIVVTGSGGARMQEGVLSLMQMPRTTLAIEELKEAGLPFIVVLTDPTSGGVLASYAMLGDVHIAEPEANLPFTGPRVIEQTIREKLPEDFQRSEKLEARGYVDMVVERKNIKSQLELLLKHLMAKSSAVDIQETLALEVADEAGAVIKVEAPAATDPTTLPS